MSYFDDEIIDKVWKKGRRVNGKDPNEYRLDAAGALMKRSHRGTDDDYDWEIDHVFPKHRLEEELIPEEEWDNLDNLRPFNAKNNVKKSDDYPTYTRKLVFDKSLTSNLVGSSLFPHPNAEITGICIDLQIFIISIFAETVSIASTT